MDNIRRPTQVTLTATLLIGLLLALFKYAVMEFIIIIGVSSLIPYFFKRISKVSETILIKEINDKASQSFVEIETSFFPLSLLQAYCTPVIEIDSVPYKRYWGKHVFIVSSGDHVIRIYHRWFFSDRCHESEVKINSSKDHITNIKWKTPILVFLPAKIIQGNSEN